MIKMKTILKYFLLTFLCGLFFLQADVNAQDDAGGRPAEAPKKTTTEKSETNDSDFEFPDIAGWKKSVSSFGGSLGDMANYDSVEGGRVTLYFYDGGRNLIPDDLTSKILKDEMLNAKAGILQFGERGLYQNIREVKNDTVTLGGKSGKVKALYAQFYFSASGNDLVSEIFLFPFKNNFLKIRASRPKEIEKSVVFQAFLAEVDAYFSN